MMQKTTPQIPIWFMRQAGRYLDEYKKTRKKAGGFLNLCFNPELASEVTLQPIKRFDFDYAIIFSDILSIPHSMGLSVTIDENQGGPLVETIHLENVKKLKIADLKKLNSVLTAIETTRKNLAAEKKLIGFCGAPWTLAVYMLQGRSSIHNAETHRFAYRYRPEFEYLIDLLTQSISDYLIEQIKAGCDTVQIFDSWASFLAPDLFEKFVIKPTVHIVSQVKKHFPHVEIIGFARGAGLNYHDYAEQTQIDIVGCDTSLSISQMQELQKICAVQGNLDNYLLLEGGPLLDRRVRELMQLASSGRYIFNLGHGVLPQTPIEHVQRVIDIIRS